MNNQTLIPTRTPSFLNPPASFSSPPATSGMGSDTRMDSGERAINGDISEHDTNMDDSGVDVPGKDGAGECDTDHEDNELYL